MKDKEAQRLLRRIYNKLAAVVEDTADLEVHFSKRKDKRKFLVFKAVSLIMKTQETLNPLAEHEDIDMV